MCIRDRSSAVKIIERYRVESRRMIKGSHEMVSPSRKKRRSSAFIHSVVCSQRAAMAYNRMWMGGGGCVGGGDGVERVEELQVESLISCRPVTGCGCCWEESRERSSVSRSWCCCCWFLVVHVRL